MGVWKVHPFICNSDPHIFKPTISHDSQSQLTTLVNHLLIMGLKSNLKLMSNSHPENNIAREVLQRSTHSSQGMEGSFVTDGVYPESSDSSMCASEWRNMLNPGHAWPTAKICLLLWRHQERQQRNPRYVALYILAQKSLEDMKTPFTVSVPLSPVHLF